MLIRGWTYRFSETLLFSATQWLPNLVLNCKTLLPFRVKRTTAKTLWFHWLHRDAWITKRKRWLIETCRGIFDDSAAIDVWGGHRNIFKNLQRTFLTSQLCCGQVNKK